MHLPGKNALQLAVVVAAGLTITAPATAQIELTEQEYFKLRVLAAEDADGLRSLFRAIDPLPPALEDMLLAFQQELLRSRKAADYMYERFGGRLDQRSDFAQALADSILNQTEILVDGIFRLPMEDQERYLAFVSLTFDEMARVEPQICADILTDEMSAVDYTRIDYIGFRALGADGLADLLTLYQAALDAEFEGRKPAVDFSDDELDVGEAALQTAALAIFKGSTLAERIGEADDIDELTGEDICALTSLVFDAFDVLDQPHRNSALRAVLGEAGF